MKNPILNEPSVTSSDSEWIQWHKDLKSVFGKKTANSLFVKFWSKRSGTTFKANTNELRSYAKSQGIKVDGQILSGVVDSAYDVVDGLGDVLKVGKYAAIGLVAVLAIAVGMLVINIARKPIEAVRAVKGN
jgi:hypothetical protein